MSRAAARRLDHLVAGIVDVVDVVAAAAGHGVGAGAAVQRVVAAAAVQRVVAGAADEELASSLPVRVSPAAPLDPQELDLRARRQRVVDAGI